MSSPVTAADYGGTLPLASLPAPDAGDEVKAEDLRGPYAALLANDKYARSGRDVEYKYTDVATVSPWVISAPNTASGNTWTNTSITLDVPNAVVGDDLKISVWGTWQFNTSSSPADVVGRLRAQITEDVDGAPVVVPNLDGVATITDDNAFNPLPHNENYSLRYTHRVTANGKARIVVQARSEDLSGGAGIGTIIMVFSARMDVTHCKRS